MWTNYAVFDDEIAVAWEYINLKENVGEYIAYLDGKPYKTTDKTHVEFTSLTPETKRAVKIDLVSPDGTVLRSIVDTSFTTEKPKRRLNVASAPYNAVGDGKTDCTKAIQQALDDCDKDECVYIPDGEYLVGALFMHSDTELFVSPNGVILGKDTYDAYEPKIPSRFEGIEMDCYASLINLGTRDAHGPYNCENVVIRGGGRITGGGQALRLSEMAREEVLQHDYLASLDLEATKLKNYNSVTGRSRGRLIHAANVRNLTVCHLTLENAPAWNLQFIYSENILTYDCTVNSVGISNGDGWDPDSSKNCTLYASTFNTGDNAIAIKSGKNPDGNRVNIPTSEVRVFDVTSHRGGGCTVGSEMSGGVSEVYFWDSDFTRCMPGLQLKGTPERGGYIRNVEIHNCKSSTLWVSSTVSYNNDGESGGTPIFENFVFEDIEIDGREYHDGIIEKERCFILTGFEKEGHLLRNVLVKNVTMLPSLDGEPQIVYIQHCENVRFENFKAL